MSHINCVYFLFYIYMANHFYLQSCLFFTGLPCVFIFKSVDITRLCLFLGSPTHSSHLFVGQLTSSMLPWFLQLILKSDHMHLQTWFFLNILLTILGPLPFHKNIYTYSANIYKTICLDVCCGHIDSVDQLKEIIDNVTTLALPIYEHGFLLQFIQFCSDVFPWGCQFLFPPWKRRIDCPKLSSDLHTLHPQPVACVHFHSHAPNTQAQIIITTTITIKLLKTR